VKGKSITEDRIRLSIEDGIADVRLNRAGKMNALDPAMVSIGPSQGKPNA
jgi:enoyl-CoA hydratase/carnithine racemase